MIDSAVKISNDLATINWSLDKLRVTFEQESYNRRRERQNDKWQQDAMFANLSTMASSMLRIAEALEEIIARQDSERIVTSLNEISEKLNEGVH